MRIYPFHSTWLLIALFISESEHTYNLCTSYVLVHHMCLSNSVTVNAHRDECGIQDTHMSRYCSLVSKIKWTPLCSFLWTDVNMSRQYICALMAYEQKRGRRLGWHSHSVAIQLDQKIKEISLSSVDSSFIHREKELLPVGISPLFLQSTQQPWRWMFLQPRALFFTSAMNIYWTHLLEDETITIETENCLHRVGPGLWVQGLGKGSKHRRNHTKYQADHTKYQADWKRKATNVWTTGELSLS